MRESGSEGENKRLRSDPGETYTRGFVKAKLDLSIIEAVRTTYGLDPHSVTNFLTGIATKEFSKIERDKLVQNGRGIVNLKVIPWCAGVIRACN